MKRYETITKDVELSNCRFVKTILMLLVVVYHACLFWTGSWFTKDPVTSSKGLAVFATWLNSFHIYGFVLVSGYVFYCIKFERAGYQEFLPFLLKKAKRLLVPYVFVAFAWVIPFSEIFFDMNSGEIVKNFVFGVAPEQLWFLLMLFFLFCAFFPLSKFFKEKRLLGFVVIGFIYGASLVAYQISSDYFQIFRALSFMPIFWLGFQLRSFGTERLYKIPVLVWLILDFALFFIVQYFSLKNSLVFTVGKHAFSLILHSFGALAVFVILQKCAIRISEKMKKVVDFLGRHSMPIYLLHQQVIYFFVYYLNGKLAPLLHMLVIFAGTMLVSLLISHLLLRFEWTAFLIGEKRLTKSNII